MMDPEVLICDEVVSALDVSIQSQILNLLADLKKERALSLLFIAHDLTVVTYFCDRVGVMYGGMIVEEADSDVVTAEPFHPYTKLLYTSIPDLDKPVNPSIYDIKEVPDLTVKPSGCPFYSRCPDKISPLCSSVIPVLKEVKPGHKTACHLYP
jgi:peptide/nickel transport system ATP-binding protein